MKCQKGHILSFTQKNKRMSVLTIFLIQDYIGKASGTVANQDHMTANSHPRLTWPSNLNVRSKHASVWLRLRPENNWSGSLDSSARTFEFEIVVKLTVDVRNRQAFLNFSTVIFLAYPKCTLD